MINIEFECTEGHRFTGTFSDYVSFQDQDRRKMIRCPVCDQPDIKRIFTGCSIHARTSSDKNEINDRLTPYEQMLKFTRFIKENFTYIENGFSEKARAIHYGIEEEKNIYGKATLDEIRELNEDGIVVFPVIDPEKKFN
jgi:hypothetical protein